MIKNDKDVYIYYPDSVEAIYKKNRYKKSYKYNLAKQFIDEFIHLMKIKHYSLDIAVYLAKKHHKTTLSTKTIYNYIDLGLLPTKNIDLPLKVKRNNKKRTIKNKRILRKSTEERPDYICERVEFGHWEIDTVIGNKYKNEPCLLTLVERKTRYAITKIIDSKRAFSVMKAINDIKEEYKDTFKDIFKTITSDNDIEFSKLT